MEPRDAGTSGQSDQVYHHKKDIQIEKRNEVLWSTYQRQVCRGQGSKVNLGHGCCA